MSDKSICTSTRSLLVQASSLRVWRFRRLASIGVLLPLSLMFALAAVIVQERVGLPSSFEWNVAYRIAQELARRPLFIAALLVSWCVGRLSLGPIVSSWREPINGSRQEIATASIAAFGTICILTYLALGIVDILAGALLAALVSTSAIGVKHLCKRSAIALLSIGVVTITLYAFTVFKSALFVIRDPLDESILQGETTLLGAPLHLLLLGAFARVPQLIGALDTSYSHFFDHMFYVSAYLVGARAQEEQTSLLGALVISYVIAGAAYYLVPTMGPRFADPTVFAEFCPDLTPFSCMVGDHLYSNTRSVIEGRGVQLEGLAYIAAFPSLHVGQEIILAWTLRRSRPLLVLSSCFVLITALATVAMGWHYFIDSIGGGMVAAAAIGITVKCERILFPRCLTNGCSRLQRSRSSSDPGISPPAAGMSIRPRE